MNPFYKNIALWLVISLMMVVLFNLFNKPEPMQDKIPYSEMLGHIDQGEVSQVVIAGNELTGQFVDGRKFRTYAPNDPDLIRTPAWKRASRYRPNQKTIRPGT